MLLKRPRTKKVYFMWFWHTVNALYSGGPICNTVGAVTDCDTLYSAAQLLSVLLMHILTTGSIQTFWQPRSCLQYLYRSAYTMLHPSINCAGALSNVCHVSSRLLVNVDYISVTRCWWASPTTTVTNPEWCLRWTNKQQSFLSLLVVPFLLSQCKRSPRLFKEHSLTSV